MSNGYPNYGSQAPYPGSALLPPPIPAPVRKKRHPLRALIIILLITAVGLGVLRYFGPVLVARSYMNDVYSYKFSDALNLVCPAEQAQVQQEFQTAGLLTMFKMNIDASHLSYIVQNETLNTASIAVTGSITANSISSQNVSDIVILESNGLWWCINADNAGPSS